MAKGPPTYGDRGTALTQLCDETWLCENTAWEGLDGWPFNPQAAAPSWWPARPLYVPTHAAAPIKISQDPLSFLHGDQTHSSPPLRPMDRFLFLSLLTASNSGPRSCFILTGILLLTPHYSTRTLHYNLHAAPYPLYLIYMHEMSCTINKYQSIEGLKCNSSVLYLNLVSCGVYVLH